MLTVNEIKEQLKDHNLRAVARATDLHENTIYSFMKSDNPRSGTAEKLSDYLEKPRTLESFAIDRAALKDGALNNEN